MEQRLEEILTELACRSADVPRNMLPVPFKSKKEILKFEKSWVEIVEEEEERQKNLLKMESELKAMAPQIKLKEKMQEELMREAPKKIVKLRQTFLAIEKSRKFWKTIHEELKVVLVKRDQEKIEFHHQKTAMSKMLKELQVVASKEIKKRSEREERRNTIQKAMHQELMEVASRNLEIRNEREERRETIWKAIHKELMVVSVKRDQEKIEFNHQKKIMSEVLKELQVVASGDFEKRSEREERRNTIQREMHQELMAVLTKKNLERKQNTKQKEMMALMLKELKVVALRELKSRNEREERRETIWKAIHKELIKFNKGTNPEDEEEDLFVPRKLFMFKVDTFKNNSPQYYQH
ncbi:golgin subfamily A member 6-like protein 26 [Saccostrea cucullata]|uniref:golgin subfamily A member 6-like protein 26 n=1 Tax=Saccostrea cuccullata TaxID=36930 RepID=UPI002ED4C5B5